MSVMSFILVAFNPLIIEYPMFPKILIFFLYLAWIICLLRTFRPSVSVSAHFRSYVKRSFIQFIHHFHLFHSFLAALVHIPFQMFRWNSYHYHFFFSFFIVLSFCVLFFSFYTFFLFDRGAKKDPYSERKKPTKKYHSMKSPKYMVSPKIQPQHRLASQIGKT